MFFIISIKNNYDLKFSLENKKICKMSTALKKFLRGKYDVKKQISIKSWLIENTESTKLVFISVNFLRGSMFLYNKFDFFECVLNKGLLFSNTT